MKKLKILVVEDESVSQAIYRKGLQSKEFKDVFDLTLVDNRQEALDSFEKTKPDIVVLDILMPVLSGFTALEKIQELEKDSDPQTGIIMVS